MIVFDLDGCLIDSEEIIRQSYKDAGAEAPADFLSLGHHGWITENRERVHAAKDTAYVLRLTQEFPPLLPPWHTAAELRLAGHKVGMLTGAPPGTLWALMRNAVSWPFASALCALTPELKTSWMSRQQPGVYVDDQTYVKVPSGWRFVHYTGQSAEELYEEVTG